MIPDRLLRRRTVHGPAASCRLRAARFAALLGVSLFAACATDPAQPSDGSPRPPGSDTTATPRPPTVATIAVTPNPLRVSVTGAVPLVAQAHDSAGNVVPQPWGFGWTSLDTTIAVVRDDVVHGMRSGQTEIEVLAGGRTVRVPVTVAGIEWRTVRTARQRGNETTCALTMTGAVYCWGWNPGPSRYGDHFGYVPFPQRLRVDVAFTELSVGPLHVCGVTAENRAYCWGDSRWRQLGVGDRDVGAAVLPVEGGLSFRTVIAAGAPTLVGGAGPVSIPPSFTCGLTTAGAAYCWGATNHRQSGSDASPASCEGAPCHPVPVPVTGGHVFTTITSGAWHSCGLTAEGVAYCWGEDFDCALGASTDRCGLFRSAPVPVIGGLRFADITAGPAHTCGITLDGAAYCWGSSIGGRLGSDQPVSPVPVPTRVAGDHRFRTIAAGSRHTCALTESGEAYCWGVNFYGELGDGTTTSRSQPTPVSGDHRFVAIAAGEAYTCGITTQRRLFCWGDGRTGQLGAGSRTSSSIPVEVLTP